jgi:hypothetical protein
MQARAAGRRGTVCAAYSDAINGEVGNGPMGGRGNRTTRMGVEGPMAGRSRAGAVHILRTAKKRTSRRKEKSSGMTLPEGSGSVTRWNWGGCPLPWPLGQGRPVCVETVKNANTD